MIKKDKLIVKKVINIKIYYNLTSYYQNVKEFYTKIHDLDCNIILCINSDILILTEILLNNVVMQIYIRLGSRMFLL